MSTPEKILYGISAFFGFLSALHMILFVGFAWAAVAEPGTSNDKTNGALLSFGLMILFGVIGIVLAAAASDSEWD